MPNFQSVERDHVVLAMNECDELGADEFLQKYGFGRAHEYVLWYEGRSYDSKAVLGVAHKYATGTAAASADFSGGKDGAAKVLSSLGFDVVSDDDSADQVPADEGPADEDPAQSEQPVTDGPRDASEVGSEAARAAWAVAARDVLLDAARQYQAVVTYKDLAEDVQRRTGITTTQLMHYWIGDVLGRVAADSASRGEPILSSLCVNAAGSVGDGYAVAIRSNTGELPADADDHAARERLACYRHFEAEGLPADGGAPELTWKLAQARARSRKTAQLEKPVATCPTCFMALPSTGVCDTCG